MKLQPLFTESDYPTDALIAHVSAGEPITIGDEIEQIDLNWMLTKGDPYCMLIRIRGDSMFDPESRTSIDDGDWVMINRRIEPKPTNIILARIRGGYTLKQHKLNDARGRGGLYLVPANDIYKPRRIEPEDEFEIIGVVTFIIKDARGT